MKVIGEYRKKHGMSQQDLAVLVGVTQGAISHIETGRLAISAKLAIRFERETNGELSFSQLWNTHENTEVSS